MYSGVLWFLQKEVRLFLSVTHLALLLRVISLHWAVCLFLYTTPFLQNTKKELKCVLLFFFLPLTYFSSLGLKKSMITKVVFIWMGKVITENQPLL